MSKSGGNCQHIFSIPLDDKFLIYSPLHHLAGLVDQDHFSIIVKALHTQDFCNQKHTLNKSQLVNELLEPVESPKPPQGFISHPLFLGLITTRGCNMSCRYCDFIRQNKINLPMTMQTVKASVNAYFDILESSQICIADIQFFGGEPFLDQDLVAFSISYARKKGRERGIQTIFEVTTNGLFSPQYCEWVADNFDCVTLSFEGSEIFQNKIRPLACGGKSFNLVFRNAKILSRGRCELTLRACVSNTNVTEMEAIAGWILNNIPCDSICFETLIPSINSEMNNLIPPDPWIFAMNFCRTEKLLSEYGVNVYTSGTDIDKVQNSFCPLGRDALIITPEGNINSCYLPEENWKKVNLNLSIGRLIIKPDGQSFFDLEQSQINHIRNQATPNNKLCSTCFCQYSCAGGCYVNHRNAIIDQQLDDVCVKTRLITISKLLYQIGAVHLWEHFVSHMQEYVQMVTGNDFSLVKIACNEKI
jgi:uncharacterized protein